MNKQNVLIPAEQVPECFQWQGEQFFTDSFSRKKESV